MRFFILALFSLSSIFQLSAQTVLITGANRGIGLEFANQYKDLGYDVIATARSPENAKELKAVGVRIEQLDVADPNSVADLAKKLEGVPIDILINNAAVCPTCQVKDMTTEVWKQTLDVNLTGTFLTCREFVNRTLDADRPGKIVNIASQAAFRGSTTGHSPYDASKGGMVSFTIALAREVSAKGINVNAIAPGMIHTEMTADTINRNRDKYLARIPLNRIATTEEVAKVTVFVASEGASYMTGATVDVTGGMLMR